MRIHISEIQSQPERWINIGDGYRETEQYGNRHAKFIDSQWLEVHWDQYNATSFPDGTINHLAHWGNEQTGIDEGILRLAGWGALLYAGIKILQKL